MLGLATLAKLKPGKVRPRKMPDRILNHLCDYALKLSYRDLPQEVIRRTKHIVTGYRGLRARRGRKSASQDR